MRVNIFQTKCPMKILIFSSHNVICCVPLFCNRSMFIIFLDGAYNYRLLFYSINVSRFYFQFGRQFLESSKLVEISESSKFVRKSQN